MCKTISFISGKGGSGKTTLALSMASLLSRCGIKTLLVDCDLSTNGATYFYEDKLSHKKKNILSFYDLLFCDNNNKKTSFVNINSNCDFIPSITQITKEITKTYTHKDDGKSLIHNDIFQKYDVVLFDCQAGYTDILKLILPLCDVNLTVMETDAISSAAMRSLYLKIGDIINEKKVYQVFNKASKDEYEIYSKVSGGTVFTNIETIMFDWKIRKAFSISQIPDLENTSANYGEQVFNVCYTILSDESIREKLKKFKSILEFHSAKEEENTLKKQISELKIKHKEKRNKTKNSVLMMTSFLLVIALTITFAIAVEGKFYEEITILTIFPLITAILSIVVAYINIFDVSKEKREYEKEIDMHQKELEAIVLKQKQFKKENREN